VVLDGKYFLDLCFCEQDAPCSHKSSTHTRRPFFFSPCCFWRPLAFNEIQKNAMGFLKVVLRSLKMGKAQLSQRVENVKVLRMEFSVVEIISGP